MLDHLAVLLSVLAPLVIVPLSVITFYLKSLRDLLRSRHEELAQRVRKQAESLGDLRASVAAFEREYATKEEWLRECLHARRVLERLMITTATLEARWTERAGGDGHAADSTRPESSPAASRGISSAK